jgi:transposase-like protein
MKLSIQLHLAELLLSNTVPILDVFGAGQVRSPYTWFHKADLQPEEGRDPDHDAVYETVIRLNCEQCWLYAAVDPKISELLHTKLETTTNKVISHSFFVELREKHDVNNAVFLIDGSLSLKNTCSRHCLDLRYE